MSALKDNLSPDSLKALVSAKEECQNQASKKKCSSNAKTTLPPIEVGNIYKIEADERNGITPPRGRKTWYKHFAVMGIADDGSLMGCVVFDSKKNRDHVEPGYDEFFIAIAPGKYPFIDHDSCLDCLKLKPATLSNIRHGKAEGRLTEEDLQNALKLTKKSNRNSSITLRIYNIA